ncbi:MAG: amidase family protein, partial [Verrucomicrobiota bacterium]
MAFTDYGNFDALGLAELVRQRQVTPAELVDAAIARAERVNPRLGAIVRLLDDGARRAATVADLRAPLAGGPFLLKDLYAEVAGAPATAGSRYLAAYKADHDSTIVARFRRAGLIPIG